MRTAAFILAMVVGLSAALYSRFYGLLFYLWFSLFRPQEWVWIDVEQYRFSLMVGLLLVAPSIATGVLPNVRHRISIAMILLLAAACLAQVNAINPDVAWFHLSVLIRLVIVSLLLVTLTDTPSRLFLVIAVMATSLGYHGAKFGVSYLVWGGAQLTAGIGGNFGTNNEFGLGLSRIIFLIICTAQNIKWLPAKLGYWAVVPLTALAIVGTYSRGAFLATACGFLVFLLLQRRKALTVVAFSAALLVGLKWAPVDTTYVDRLRTIRTYEAEPEQSALGRLHFWKVAMIMVAANPLGVGLRNFELGYDHYDFSFGAYQTRRSVHSSHFQALAETGYAGAALWVFLLGYSLWRTWRVRRASRSPDLSPDTRRLLFTSANALMASQVAFIVGGSFHAELLNDLNWFMFALVAALDFVSRSAMAGSGLRTAPASAVSPSALPFNGSAVASGEPGAVARLTYSGGRLRTGL